MTDNNYFIENLDYPSLDYLDNFEYYKNKIKNLKSSLKQKELIIDDDNLEFLQKWNIINLQSKDTIVINKIRNKHKNKYIHCDYFELIQKDIYKKYLILDKLTININNPNILTISFEFCNIKKLYITSKYIKYLYCNSIYLNQIILHCNKLILFECNNNFLTNININKCKKISVIDCSDNNIHHITFNKCNKIKKFYAKNNQITDISFNNLPIEEINLYSNLIENINITNCPKIEKLNLKFNNIKNLILSNMYFIKKINILDNPIRKINLNNIGNNTGYIDIIYNSNAEIKHSSIFDMTKSFNDIFYDTTILEPNKNNIKYTNYKSYKEYKKFMDDLEMII